MHRTRSDLVFAVLILLSSSPGLGLEPGPPLSPEAGALLARLDAQRDRGLDLPNHALSRMGKRAVPALSSLMLAFEYGSPETRWDIVQTLVKVGPESVPLLAKLLESKDPLLRQDAVHVLGLMGKAAAKATPELVKGLNDPVPGVQIECALALGRIGPGPNFDGTVLLMLAHGKDSAVRRAAALALSQLKLKSIQTPVWVAQALKSPDLATRRDAIYLLRVLGPAAQGTNMGIEIALKDVDPVVRMEAVNCLCFGGDTSRTQAVVQLLYQCLDDVDGGVRRQAIFTLGQLKPKYTDVAEHLKKVLEDDDPSVRREAVRLIGKLGRQALDKREVRQVLATAMRSSDAQTAQCAVDELTRMGAEALDDFIGALRDGDANLRLRAVAALGGIPGQPAKATAALLGSLDDKEPAVVQQTIRVLGKVGGKSTDVVEALLRALDSATEGVPELAAEALARIGEPAIPGLTKALDARVGALKAKHVDMDSWPALQAEMVPVLMEGLQSNVEFVRWHKAQELGVLGPHAAKAVPALIQTLNDSSSQVRFSASEALSKVGLPAIPALTAALKSDSAWVRTGAAIALGKMGADATDALTALETAHNDDDGEVRAAIGEALVRIGGGLKK